MIYVKGDRVRYTGMSTIVGGTALCPGDYAFVIEGNLDEDEDVLIHADNINAYVAVQPADLDWLGRI